jgi:hypothetical protein
MRPSDRRRLDWLGESGAHVMRLDDGIFWVWVPKAGGQEHEVEGSSATLRAAIDAAMDELPGGPS